MIACPVCADLSPNNAEFCMECGAPLHGTGRIRFSEAFTRFSYANSPSRLRGEEVGHPRGNRPPTERTSPGSSRHDMGKLGSAEMGYLRSLTDSNPERIRADNGEHGNKARDGGHVDDCGNRSLDDDCGNRSLDEGYSDAYNGPGEGGDGQNPLHGMTTATNAMAKQDRCAHDAGVGTEFISPSGIRFILVPPGTFSMGSWELSDATPHRVAITRPFYIGQYPVTQREWRTVTGHDPSHFTGDDLPVEMVTWRECREFIGTLNEREGTTRYRLPTEAEWEYACRAGSTTAYHYGDDPDELDVCAWYADNSGDLRIDGSLLWKQVNRDTAAYIDQILANNNRTHPVGLLMPNAWDLYDMHGNVWEWCEDRYGASYYEESPVEDPSGPPDGSDRVVRGGCWNNTSGGCTSAHRSYFDPDDRDAHLGFRVLREMQDRTPPASIDPSKPSPVQVHSRHR